MGYLMVLGECWACKRLFTFSAERVPSVPIEGVRQPICRTCVERANVERAASGRPLITILPGAYDPDEVA